MKEGCGLLLVVTDAHSGRGVGVLTRYNHLAVQLTIRFSPDPRSGATTTRKPIIAQRKVLSMATTITATVYERTGTE